MTEDGGKYPEAHWDEARIALGRVAQFFKIHDENHVDFTLEELRAVRNYELIPKRVREALEGLTLDERQLLDRIFTTLGQNNFYLENALGGLFQY
jgi:hypothetical protein